MSYLVRTETGTQTKTISFFIELYVCVLMTCEYVIFVSNNSRQMTIIMMSNGKGNMLNERIGGNSIHIKEVKLNKRIL